MANTTINAFASGQVIGTIASGGTLTDPFDLDEFTKFGLFVGTGAVAGTMTFLTSNKRDGTYVTIKDNQGSNVTIDMPSGGFAIGGDQLTFLQPYRYVKIQTTGTQTNGLEIIMPVKA